METPSAADEPKELTLPPLASCTLVALVAVAIVAVIVSLISYVQIKSLHADLSDLMHALNDDDDDAVVKRVAPLAEALKKRLFST